MFMRISRFCLKKYPLNFGKFTIQPLAWAGFSCISPNNHATQKAKAGIFD
jgi:hypothetical protein